MSDHFFAHCTCRYYKRSINYLLTPFVVCVRCKKWVEPSCKNRGIKSESQKSHSIHHLQLFVENPRLTDENDEQRSLTYDKKSQCFLKAIIRPPYCGGGVSGSSRQLGSYIVVDTHICVSISSQQLLCEIITKTVLLQ